MKTQKKGANMRPFTKIVTVTPLYGNLQELIPEQLRESVRGVTMEETPIFGLLQTDSSRIYSRSRYDISYRDYKMYRGNMSIVQIPTGLCVVRFEVKKYNKKRIAEILFDLQEDIGWHFSKIEEFRGNSETWKAKWYNYFYTNGFFEKKA